MKRVATNNTSLPSITPELRKLFENNGYIKQFKKDDVVLKEDANIKTIPIVVSGRLKVLQQEVDGREVLLYYINPGESCIVSVFGGLYNEKSKLKAIAELDSELLMIPSNKVGEWIQLYPDWIQFILTLYHKRFEDLLQIVNEMAFQNMSDRVLMWLKKKSEFDHLNEVNATHQQIADELGSTREVISRLLKQLEKEEKIKLKRNKISLKN